MSTGTKWLTSILSMFGLVCCADDPQTTNLVSARTAFNQRLRADKGPAAGIPTPRFYSDGGARDGDLISELYHSLMPSDSLPRLRRSDCLWVQQDGFPVLSYEVLLADVVARIDGQDVPFPETSDDPIGTCGLRGRFAETRQPADIEDLGTFSEFGLPGPEVLGFTVGLRSCTHPLGRPDPYGVCAPIDRCGPLADTRDVLLGGEPDYELTAESDYGDGEARPVTGGLLPYCWVRGAPRGGLVDTSYRLEVVPVLRDPEVEGPLPSLETRPHSVRPDLKVVPGVRTLARPLAFFREGKGDGFDRSFWRWRVPLTSDDRWVENFSPGLMVSTVRVFEDLGANPDTNLPNRAYLRPDRILVDMTSECVGDGNPDRVDVVFDLAGCGLTVTPTYRLERLDRGMTIDDDHRLAWGVEFRKAHADRPGPRQPLPSATANLYIEFEVIDRTLGFSGSALSIGPAGFNMGHVRINKNSVVDGAFTVSNIGLASARVESVSFDGPGAASFSATPSGNVTLPLVLGALDSFDVSVEAHPTQVGVQQAYLMVSARDAAGQLFEVRAALLAQAVEAILVVLPSSMFFSREDGSPDRLDFERLFTVHNAGDTDLLRGAVTVSGPDAASFTITEAEYPGGSGFGPVAARQPIAPGAFEDFRVVFHPGRDGFHDAEITIATDAGSESIVVSGLCDGTCAYPPP